MKLTRSAPTAPVLRPEFERMFDRFLRPFELMRPFEFPETNLLETVWTPPVDLSETDKEYVVKLEIPGVHKENLDVSLEGNVLTLSGRREYAKKEEGEEYIWQERAEGKFIRSLRLPKAVLEGKIEATYQDGILTVHLPKVEPTPKSKIAIK